MIIQKVPHFFTHPRPTHATVCLTFMTLRIAEQYPAVTLTKYDPFCTNILNSMCILTMPFLPHQVLSSEPQP
jgi:hypothetical protein